MTTVSRQELLQVAAISRIAIHEHELDGLVHQVQEILAYAARVSQVATDVDKDEARLANVVRQDTVVMIPVELLLKQAPEREGNYFVVPRVLDSTE